MLKSEKLINVLHFQKLRLIEKEVKIVISYKNDFEEQSIWNHFNNSMYFNEVEAYKHFNTSFFILFAYSLIALFLIRISMVWNIDIFIIRIRSFFLSIVYSGVYY